MIVTGPPASAKSTLAEKIADALRMPLLSKDSIKEKLFDTLGWDDRSWSERLDDVAYAVLFYYLEIQLKAG